jgi:hypothetical protein
MTFSLSPADAGCPLLKLNGTPGSALPRQGLDSIACWRRLVKISSARLLLRACSLLSMSMPGSTPVLAQVSNLRYKRIRENRFLIAVND